MWNRVHGWVTLKGTTWVGERGVCSLGAKLNIPHRVRKSQGILFPKLENPACQMWDIHWIRGSKGVISISSYLGQITLRHYFLPILDLLYKKLEWQWCLTHGISRGCFLLMRHLGECCIIKDSEINYRHLQNSNTCLSNSCFRVLGNTVHGRQGWGFLLNCLEWEMNGIHGLP